MTFLNLFAALNSLLIFLSNPTIIVEEPAELVPSFNLVLEDTTGHWNIFTGKTESYEVYILSEAVGLHETGMCNEHKAPEAHRKNNCWGIMVWNNGVRSLKNYSSIAEGRQDFMRLWSTKYKRFPTMAEAQKYSGNDRAKHWLKNVHYFYNKLINNQ